MDYSQQIYTQARSGTAYNPGLPGPLATLLVAQARHETGNFTSRFFRENNNAFGYSYYAGSNYQSGAGGIADNGQPIANYGSIEDSTKEIVDWLYRRYRQGVIPDMLSISTPEQYAQALKAANYYGDSFANYLKGLKRFFAPIAPVVAFNAILVAGILLYVFRKQLF